MCRTEAGKRESLMEAERKNLLARADGDAQVAPQLQQQEPSAADTTQAAYRVVHLADGAKQSSGVTEQTVSSTKDTQGSVQEAVGSATEPLGSLHEARVAGRTLIVAPLGVVTVWERELEVIQPALVMHCVTMHQHPYRSLTTSTCGFQVLMAL